MNNAVSARPEGTACVTPVTVSANKTARRHVANIWLLVANQVLQSLGPTDHVELYVDTSGGLLAQPWDEEPPADSLYVCKIRPGTSVEVIAARLRHASSRWRIEPSIVPGGDND